MKNEPRRVRAQIVNAFTINGAGGNPAGVVFNADTYSEEDMLNIAERVGLSETAFVSKSDAETLKLDFFTPNRRIAHCGHATVATFSYLATVGSLADGAYSKQTIDGPRKILIKEDAAYMEQLAPSFINTRAVAALGVTVRDTLLALGLLPQNLYDENAVTVVNTGNSFLVVHVKDGESLAGIKPNFEQIASISEQLDLIGFYVFTTDPKATDYHATSRMFAPRFSITEESATGMAAGPLACYLREYLGITDRRIKVEQGTFMQPKSTSLINVDLEVINDKIVSLMAGGYGSIKRELDIII